MFGEVFNLYKILKKPLKNEIINETLRFPWETDFKLEMFTLFFKMLRDFRNQFAHDIVLSKISIQSPLPLTRINKQLTATNSFEKDFLPSKNINNIFACILIIVLCTNDLDQLQMTSTRLLNAFSVNKNISTQAFKLPENFESILVKLTDYKSNLIS